MLSEHRRRQILDDDAMGAPGATSAPGNGPVQEDSPQAEDSCEDSWVSSFMGRLAALVRDVSGREK